MKNYDLIIIGLGSAGLTLSISMAKAGFKVLGIDKDARSIGGDCLNYGCVPSKALIHVSRLVHASKKTESFGIKTSGKVDIKKVTDYIFEKQELVREHESPEYLEKEGVELALGWAKFVDSHTVEVSGERYRAKRIVIATGSVPRKLNTKGIEQVEHSFTNENIFKIDFLPKRFLFVGAGPINCELGQAFHRLGSEVIIVNRGDRILGREHPKVSSLMEERLRLEGIEIINEAEVSAFVSNTRALIKKKNGEVRELDFDALMVGIGRIASISSLSVEKAGILLGEKERLVLSDTLQTNVKHIYACGDVAGKGQFSHLAAEQASIILSNFFIPFKKAKSGRKPIPAVTYTEPEVATFGYREDELKKMGKKYQIIEHDMHGDRATVSDFRYGKILIYLEKGKTILGEKLLGGTIVAPHAGEMVQEFIMTQNQGKGFLNIMGTIHPYPTATNDAKAAFLEHVIGKIGPRLQKVLKFLY
ncbi:MAG: NAD(P)/FAD-dependent oxidoreductase [Bacteroidia bacterium]|nr:NAD(P)/FAD-dependent oxidoreductase [Bacteroidia bacterium]